MPRNPRAVSLSRMSGSRGPMTMAALGRQDRIRAGDSISQAKPMVAI